MTLSVSNLSVARGGRPLMRGVSFSVAAGQALILKGQNGIGKTTLLRTVAGLQPPLSGEISGAEESIAYAGHADGLKAMLTVKENLRFWSSVFGSQSIEAALNTFDLVPLADRMAGMLSAGQKRRLGLARLLVTGRPVWVLDEPTVSLDQTSVARFANAVERHLETGGSALMATHIDLGLSSAATLDLSPFKASAQARSSDEAFL